MILIIKHLKKQFSFEWEDFMAELENTSRLSVSN